MVVKPVAKILRQYAGIPLSRARIIILVFGQGGAERLGRVELGREAGLRVLPALDLVVIPHEIGPSVFRYLVMVPFIWHGPLWFRSPVCSVCRGLTTRDLSREIYKLCGIWSPHMVGPRA